MRGRKLLAMHASIIGALCAAGTLSPLMAQSDAQTLARDNTAFAMRLYGELAGGTDGNLIISPYSISAALSMTMAGARGETERQMAGTLNFSLPRGALHAAFGKLDTQIRGAEGHGLRLLTANSLWPQKGFPLLAEYLDLVSRDYGAAITGLDYVNGREAARTTINHWVAEKTADKITDLLQESDITALTRLVLVNAIYFKGNWAVPFNAAVTRPAPFHLAADVVKEVPMMSRELHCRHAALAQLDILELPYAGGKMSMVVLLPKEVDGLSKLEKQLTADTLAEWLAQLSAREVKVFLPKFKADFRFDLSRMLTGMGMTDAFSGRADFSGMNGQTDLSISAVIHQAFVEVNEEGTEAAAATAVVMRTTALPAPPPLFRADHPFLYLIREGSTGSVLFMGRMASP